MEGMVLAVLAVWAGLELLGLGPALGNYESFLFPAHGFLFGLLSAGLGVLNLVAACAYWLRPRWSRRFVSPVAALNILSVVTLNLLVLAIRIVTLYFIHQSTKY